jgi:leader peptidase (prepilin peptidase)/N-methyltransferase
LRFLIAAIWRCKNRMGIKVCLLSFLTFSAWTDIRKREIYIVNFLFFGAAGIIINYEVFKEIFWGIGPGIIFLVLSKITKGAVGRGDGLLIIVTGMYLGFTKNLILLMLSLLLASCFGIAIFFVKSFQLKIKLPFAPFLLAGFICLLFMEYL